MDSARTLPHKYCGFVNFVNVEDAMDAKVAMNGYEVEEGRVLLISYAKVPDSEKTEKVEKEEERSERMERSEKGSKIMGK